MKKLHLLKTLIDLFFFFAILSMAAMIVMIPIVLFVPDMDVPIKVKGVDISTMDSGAKFMLVFAAAGALCFVYAVYCLRKTIVRFNERKIFHPEVVVNLSRTGTYVIAASLLTNIPLFFYNVIYTNQASIDFGASGFDSLILSVCLGLFFIVLSEVFKMAIHMKEENELTV
ncbi:MAG TPA: DUF2975 domain-containing protein [Flavobacterium sp.]|jgi:hypothetical protein